MTAPAPGKSPARSLRDESLRKILKILGSIGLSQKYPKDAEICMQGSIVDYVLVVESGVVALRHTRTSGERWITGLRKAPWIVGTYGLLTRQPLAVSTVTMSECIVRQIPATVFLEKWKHNAAFSWAMHELHALEQAEHQFQIVRLACYSTRQRLEEFIWDLTNEDPGAKRVQLFLNGEQQSQLLGISLSHLNAIYKELEDEGILKRENGWLRIPDRKRLWRSPIIVRKKYSTPSR